MTLPKIQSVTALTEEFKGALLDAYGVFWGGNELGLLPGSKELMEYLIRSGKVVGVLSNSTQLSAKEIDKLKRHGLLEGHHFHFLITSGDLVRAAMLQGVLPFPTPRRTFWLFGGVHPQFSTHTAIFQGTHFQETQNIDEADFIYLSVPHLEGRDQTDPELFREAVKSVVSKGLPMVCPNPDRFAHEGKPVQAVVRQGSIALLYEELGGKVFYFGKPYQEAYQTALQAFQKHHIHDPSDILMVGDTPETDIRGARRQRLSTVLTVKTGMMAERINLYGHEEALSKLPPDDMPDYLIERFAYDL